MKLIHIPEPRTWRPDGQTLLHFGTYRVPQDISEALAQRALDEGVAEEVKPAEDTKAAPAARKTTKGPTP